MAGSAITGSGQLAGAPTAYSGSNSQLSQAIQTIWSKEILFQAMPILRFEQFAVKKTELGVAPGLRVNFLRYKNFTVDATPLTEGVRMTTNALTAEQIAITVAEHGYAVAVSELLLNASFDDVMASASRLLGRHMAQYLDTQARNTLSAATSATFGYDRSGLTSSTTFNTYAEGTAGTKLSDLTGAFKLTTGAIKDAALQLAQKNIPRIGETYVQFIHPKQSRDLRSNPEFIEVTKYAAPGNFMLGEIGRLYDVVFIETTQINKLTTGGTGFGQTSGSGVVDETNYTGVPADQTGVPVKANTAPGSGGNPIGSATPNPAGGSNGTVAADVYESIMIGDNAFGHAISLPVELRDGGVLDFGREHALAWYAIWGLGIITDQAINKVYTN
jgi:N4-gp56 family major capsid protein